MFPSKCSCFRAGFVFPSILLSRSRCHKCQAGRCPSVPSAASRRLCYPCVSVSKLLIPGRFQAVLVVHQASWAAKHSSVFEQVVFPQKCFGFQFGSPVAAGLGATLGAQHVLWRWQKCAAVVVRVRTGGGDVANQMFRFPGRLFGGSRLCH